MSNLRRQALALPHHGVRKRVFLSLGFPHTRVGINCSYTRGTWGAPQNRGLFVYCVPWGHRGPLGCLPGRSPNGPGASPRRSRGVLGGSSVGVLLGNPLVQSSGGVLGGSPLGESSWGAPWGSHLGESPRGVPRGGSPGCIPPGEPPQRDPPYGIPPKGSPLRDPPLRDPP